MLGSKTGLREHAGLEKHTQFQELLSDCLLWTGERGESAEVLLGKIGPGMGALLVAKEI